jgi:hypothetical protein
MSKGKSASLLERARLHFKFATEAEEAQREREREDLRFQVPEFQWTDQAKKDREGRPTLSINKLDQPRQLILNQMRAADLGVQIAPLSEDADPDTAEMLQGLYRSIERDGGELARFWAFDRAVSAGRGYYRILTEYDPSGGMKGDQRIVLKRIYHQDGVLLDPAAQEPDWSDGCFAFVLTWMSADKFKEEFPNAKQTPSTKLEWEQSKRTIPEWVRDDDVLVAEYWTKEYSEGDEYEPPKVKVSKVCGWEVLEAERDWPGQYIPIVPVVGRELQPFDEERRLVGLIGPAKDGQTLYNFAASTLVERMSLEPKAPFVGAAKQFEGYEAWWKQANRALLPYLPYNHVEGLPAPQRAQIDASGMSIAMMALQEADQFIQASTAVFDPSLGRLPQKERSGKAILALQQQADAGTSHYLQNLADISMKYEAKVILDLIPKIYDRPERVIRIIHGDDRKSTAVMIGAPYTTDDKKRPQLVQGWNPQQSAPMPEGAKYYDLSRGVYDVSISIGKAFQTRLDEGREKIGELLSAKPELFMMMGDIFLNYADWPGSKDMAKRMEKIRERTFPGLGENEDGQAPPEQMQAELAGMKQQMQMMGQQLQMAMQQIETDRAKQEASLMKAKMDNETKLRIAAADNETKLALAGMEQKFEALLTMLNLEHEFRQVREAAALDAAKTGQQMDHERTMAAGQQQHEAVMGELGREAPEKPEPVEPQA